MAHLESVELPPLKPDQVLVRMLFAPINPADLNVIEGSYARRLCLEGGAVPGGEGVGRIEEVGAAVTGLPLGALVLLPTGVGTWSEACVVAADEVVLVPRGIAPEQASMLRVNPATALRMLSDFVELKPGDWLIQNAANSGVGRAVIQIARHRGWRTINVVRREELIPELLAMGADHVVLEEEAGREQVKIMTGGAPIALALNAVGGESALRLANALEVGGTLVTYGAMSRQPLRIPNGLLIFQDLSWRGFWITLWYERASPESRGALFRELFDLAQKGVIHSLIEKIYPLAAIEAALTRAQQGHRSGKILLAH